MARGPTKQQRAAASTVIKAADTLALAQQLRESADASPTDKPKNLALPSHDQIASAIECAASHLLGFTPRAVNLIDRALQDANTVNLINPTVDVPAYGPAGEPLLNPDGSPMLIPIPDERARLTNVKVRQQGLDVARDVLLTAGILPAHTSSRIVANFFLGADAPGFAPILRQLLGLNETVPIPDGDGRVSIDADFEDTTDALPE